VTIYSETLLELDSLVHIFPEKQVILNMMASSVRIFNPSSTKDEMPYYSWEYDGVDPIVF
jgi:hypothetical protein